LDDNQHEFELPLILDQIKANILFAKNQVYYGNDIMKRTITTVPRDFIVLRLKTAGLTLLLMLSLPPSLLAQNRPVKFERLSLEQGLSQSSVYCLLQDRQGFMWFGTQDGLNKYDGYRFTVYKHDVLDSNSLSNNCVNSIYEDRAGTLWIGTQDGRTQ